MYIEQWNNLSAQIRGLVGAAKVYASFLAVQNTDSYGTAKGLGEQAESILMSIEEFRANFQDTISQTALDSINDFIEKTSGIIKDQSVSSDSKRLQVQSAIVQLAAFEAKITFLLSDTQAIIKKKSELALSHLQRMIVVDEAYRDKWINAFNIGEIECEKLGAIHLLHHGIWAFKVDALGSRTDLVYQEPSNELNREKQFVDGFVLTEWKKTNNSTSADAKFKEANNQAKKYVSGALGGLELTQYRYAIVVSESNIAVPPDYIEDGVIYRHINISVIPKVPSKS